MQSQHTSQSPQLLNVANEEVSPVLESAKTLNQGTLTNISETDF